MTFTLLSEPFDYGAYAFGHAHGNSIDMRDFIQPIVSWHIETVMSLNLH